MSVVPAPRPLLGHHLTGLALRGLGAGVLILGAVLFGTMIGETAIPARTVLCTLANRLFDAAYPIDPIDEGIIWGYRLTRAIVAASCGAVLAVSGVILQSLLRNPLAEPYLLGISAGASTGAVLVTVAGIGGGLVSLSAGALAGALTSFVLVALLAQAAGGAGGRASGHIILAGIAGSQMFNALTSFIITRSANSEQVRGIMFWLLGNLSGVRWDDVGLAVPVAVATVAICLWHIRALDAFAFGAEAASALGVPVRRVRMVLIASVAMGTAVMVSLVGAIGFVGLVVPHAVRLVFGARHGILVPGSAVLGAVFLITADVVSRVLIVGQTLPIGVITALVGAPCFALILLRARTGR